MPDRSPIVFRASLSLLTASPGRFGITVAGIALCVMLMGFLVGIYRGVSEGSVAFVRRSQADAWVLQQGTTNILRGFSLLTNAHGNLLEEIPAVQSLSPVLFRLSTVETPSGPATTYLTGFDPSGSAGGPPEIHEGRSVLRRGELVLDRAFAMRWSCTVGDTLFILDTPFTVTGISTGTNMFAIQYAFTHIEDVRALYGISDLVSAFIIDLQDDADPAVFIAAALSDVPGISAYDRDTFLRQNVSEMENGFLPIILVMMMISAVLLTVIIGLLLTMSVLERRHEYAVLKAIGSPGHFLPVLVFIQSFLLVVISTLTAGLVFIPLTLAVGALTPEVSIAYTATDVAHLGLILWLLVISGTILPLMRLRGIYPIEAFT